MNYKTGKIIFNKNSDFCCNEEYLKSLYDDFDILYKRYGIYPQSTMFERVCELAHQAAGRKADSKHVIQPVDIKIWQEEQSSIIWQEKQSLKTECTKTSKPDFLNMSKFAEISHIRELPLETIIKIYYEHSSKYDRLIFLQSLSNRKKYNVYQLFEIPLDLLKININPQLFQSTKRTSIGSCTIPVHRNGEYLYSIRIDGAARKISLQNIPAKDCILHARFFIPKE